jgi:hypothetical protein
MTATVAEPQGATVRGKPKDAGGKLSTVGIRTGSEAGCRRQAGAEQRSPKVIKTHQVEPDGKRGDFAPYLWEISSVRAGEKSAEAVVARKAGNAAGAKGRRTKLEKELEGRRKKRARITGASTTGADLGVRGNSGAAATHPKRGDECPNSADLSTESDVQDVDGSSRSRRKLPTGPAGGETQQGSSGHRPDDYGGPGAASSGELVRGNTRSKVTLILSGPLTVIALPNAPYCSRKSGSA